MPAIGESKEAEAAARAEEYAQVETEPGAEPEEAYAGVRAGREDGEVSDESDSARGSDGSTSSLDLSVSSPPRGVRRTTADDR